MPMHHEERKITMKNVFTRVFLCFLLTFACFLGTAAGTVPEKASLHITVTPEYGSGCTKIPLPQSKFKEVTLWDIADITIDIDGTTRKLADALQDGSVTVEQLIADARQDADQGYCHEKAVSKNGLTEFTYYYGDFRLHYVYDIYETPDGKQHLIADFSIIESHSDVVSYRYSYDENGNCIDFEDWGLTFTVSQADDVITVVCTQSGGQQFGNLQFSEAFLEKKNPSTQQWESLEDNFTYDCIGTALTMGGTTELTFDVTEKGEPLPAGDYSLAMQFTDCYDPEEMPSLMRKYHDRQWYTVEFTIQPRS